VVVLWDVNKVISSIASRPTSCRGPYTVNTLIGGSFVGGARRTCSRMIYKQTNTHCNITNMTISPMQNTNTKKRVMSHTFICLCAITLGQCAPPMRLNSSSYARSRSTRAIPPTYGLNRHPKPNGKQLNGNPPADDGLVHTLKHILSTKSLQHSGHNRPTVQHGTIRSLLQDEWTPDTKSLRRMDQSTEGDYSFMTVLENVDKSEDTVVRPPLRTTTNGTLLTEEYPLGGSNITDDNLKDLNDASGYNSPSVDLTNPVQTIWDLAAHNAVEELKATHPIGPTPHAEHENGGGRNEEPGPLVNQTTRADNTPPNDYIPPLKDLPVYEVPIYDSFIIPPVGGFEGEYPTDGNDMWAV
jgi:hypothetical protein